MVSVGRVGVQPLRLDDHGKQKLDVSVSEIAAKFWKYLNRNQPMTAIDPKRSSQLMDHEKIST